MCYRKQNALLKCIHFFDQEKIEAHLEDLQNQVVRDHPHIVKVLDYEVCEKDTGHCHDLSGKGFVFSTR